MVVVLLFAVVIKVTIVTVVTIVTMVAWFPRKIQKCVDLRTFSVVFILSFGLFPGV
jgi:hypothetical protein